MRDITITREALAEKYGYKVGTIRTYLNTAAKYNLCDFDVKSIREKYSTGLISSVICLYKNNILS